MDINMENADLAVKVKEGLEILVNDIAYLRISKARILFELHRIMGNFTKDRTTGQHCIAVAEEYVNKIAALLLKVSFHIRYESVYIISPNESVKSIFEMRDMLRVYEFFGDHLETGSHLEDTLVNMQINFKNTLLGLFNKLQLRDSSNDLTLQEASTLITIEAEFCSSKELRKHTGRMSPEEMWFLGKGSGTDNDIIVWKKMTTIRSSSDFLRHGYAVTCPVCCDAKLSNTTDYSILDGCTDLLCINCSMTFLFKEEGRHCPVCGKPVDRWTTKKDIDQYQQVVERDQAYARAAMHELRHPTKRLRED